MKPDTCGFEKCRGQSRNDVYGVMAQRSTHEKRGLHNGKLKDTSMEDMYSSY